MPNLLTSDIAQEALRNDLKHLCNKYKLTELLLLAEVDCKQTVLIQNSNTKRSNKDLNDLFDNLHAMLKATAEKTNTEYKIIYDGKQ